MSKQEEEDGQKDSLSKERTFLEGWQNFTARVAIELKIHPDPNKSMARSILHLVPVFGSIKTSGNSNLEHLRTLIDVASAKDLEPVMQLTCLRLINAIIFLQPSCRLMTQEQRDVEWSRFLRHREPSGKKISGVHFSELLDDIARMGGVQAAMKCVCESTEPENTLEALRLGVLLLSDGRLSVQDAFHQGLASPTSGQFFEELHNIMHKALSILKEGRGILKQGKPSHAENQLPVNVRQVFYVFKMIRRLLSGRHRPLQDLFRVQRLNRVSVNLLIEAMSLLQELINDLSHFSSLEERAFIVADAVTDVFEMYANAMSGSNYANQAELAGSAAPSLFDLADRICQPQKLPILDTLKKVGKTSRGSVVPLEMDPSKLRKRNVICSQLKQSVTRCLLTFLEGSTQSSQLVTQQMLVTLNWKAILSQLEASNQALFKDELISSEEVMKEGVGYYKLLRLMEVFDTTGTQIASLLSKTTAEAALKFFSQRVGCVEVQHKERIERVMFAMPSSCLPGGPMQDVGSLNELMQRVWVNRVEKNWELVQMLVKLAEREKHIESLRRSTFAFTVSHGRLIQQSSRFVVILLHSVVVLGGYIEPWAMIQSKESESTETGTNAVLNQTIDVLMYVLLLTATVRAVSFAIYHIPLMIDEYKLKQEKIDTSASNVWSLQNNSGVPDELIKEASDLACVMGLVEESKNNRIPHLDTSQQNAVMDQTSGFDKWVKNRVRPLWDAASSRVFALGLRIRFWYEVGFVISAVLAIVYRTPMPTAFALLEFVASQSNQPIIHAIQHNSRELASCFILGLLITYVYLVVGLWTMSETRDNEKCINMFQCTVHMMLRAYSYSGLSDFFSTDFRIADNLAEAVEDGAGWRFFFEFSYLLIIGQCIVAVVLAVIIDGMQAVRLENQAAISDLNNRCFICDLTLFRLGQAGITFKHHTQIVHNPLSYLHFVVYLRQVREEVDGAIPSAVERYVMDMIWCPPAELHMRAQWLPQESTWLLEGKQVSSIPTAFHVLVLCFCMLVHEEVRMLFV